MWVSIAATVATVAGTVLAFMVRPENVTPNLLDALLPATACAALLVRRRFPVASLLVIAVCTALYYPYARLDGPLLLLLLIGLYTAADQGHLIAAIATGAASLLGMGIGEVGGVRHVDDTQFMMIGGWVVAAVAFGGVTKNRRAFQREAEQRAIDAERTKEEEAKRRESEERLRIARELHDVLGHNISMINVQAGAALHGLKKRPEDAEAALRTIKETSKDTLRQLRTTLGVLRQVDEEAPTAPADSLDRLDELVNRSGLKVTTVIERPADAAETPPGKRPGAVSPPVSEGGEGLPVQANPAGPPAQVDPARLPAHVAPESLPAHVAPESLPAHVDPARLPAPVDLAAVRIIQEALANVSRHSGSDEATITITHLSGNIVIRVEDEGPGAVYTEGGGFGVQGMRERAAALGGTLEAGPRPEGGFAVVATLPLGTPVPTNHVQDG